MSCAAVWVPSPCSPSPVPPRHRRGRWRRGSASSSSSSAFRACAGGDASGDGGGGGRPARMVLHDSLEGAGVSTEHARAAREGFAKQVGRLTRLDAETSIAISRGADLARAALCVAAEDDSLVSHSSVPLPVEAFVSRLDDLSTGFLADGYLPPAGAPPQVFLDHLDRYLYVHKGFRRKNGSSDGRAIYLHSVLTCRLGSALMLSLIYSEILKMLRLYGLLEFNVEIFFPHDLNSLPRGYDKHKSKLGDEPHIMTSKSLLVEILKTLKNTFWPFQSNQSGSLFLNAVSANQHGPGNVGDNQTTPHGNISTIEVAAAKAAQHRLMRGVWTNVRFGDMRRALAACERLILLNHDPRELRDYAALLYHCGYYEDCLQYLASYQTAVHWNNPLEIMEDEAVNTLRARVSLILAEDGWSSRRSPATSYWTKNSEPW
uniref:Protein SirB1 N-terminal domain-containing protein n=1 Tax=Oryza rufipogon TaxID=4529 RepID=A0A0E0MUI3_ORYRU